MTTKPVKVPPASSKKAPQVERKPAIDKRLTEDAPGPVREDSKNLRQRAEWFRRRSGDTTEK
jgi:hypothetical protein